MYRDLLHRNPAQTEVAGWVNNLNHGASTQSVAYGFAASFERESMRVQADYHQYLGRSASTDEVYGWVNNFEHGSTNEDVVSGFVGSYEYFANHGSNVNGWLAAAYVDALGRPIDASALAFWDAALL